jgi:small-conductance mechanosensitive channel
LLTELILKMSINKGINETQRVPQAVAAGPLTEITDSIRSTHKETVEMLSHVNHTLSMYKLQISDLKSQLDDIKQTMQSDTFKLDTFKLDTFKLDNFNQVIMQELQHIKESDTVMKSDIENIKNTISKLLSQPTTTTPTTAPSTAMPTTAPTTAMPTTAPTTAMPTTAMPTTAMPTTAPTTAEPTTAPSTAEPTNKPSTDNLSNLLNNEINNTTTDSDLLTQLTSEPQKVTVAVPKAPRGRRPRK